MSPLAIAVLGAGLIGRQHIERMTRSSECELVAIVDPAATAIDVAKAYGVPVYSELSQLLENHHLDGVIVATPNALHAEQALQCLDSGLAVLIEKPIAHCCVAALPLLAVEQDKGAKILVGHHRLHSPIMEKAIEVVQSGEIGRIVGVMGSALLYKPTTYFEDGPWRAEPGGGPILINLIHDIGNLRALCGEIASVHATTSNTTRNYAVEDTVAISLRFKSGALGTFLLSDTAASSASWEHTAQENPAYPHDINQDCYQISGTEGTLSVPTLRLQKFADGTEKSWWTPLDDRTLPFERADPLVRQLAHFCSVIRGDVPPRVSTFDGIQNLKVTEAVAQSARTGQIIPIEN